MIGSVCISAKECSEWISFLLVRVLFKVEFWLELIVITVDHRGQFFFLDAFAIMSAKEAGDREPANIPSASLLNFRSIGNQLNDITSSSLNEKADSTFIRNAQDLSISAGFQETSVNPILLPLVAENPVQTAVKPQTDDHHADSTTPVSPNRSVGKVRDTPFPITHILPSYRRTVFVSQLRN